METDQLERRKAETKILVRLPEKYLEFLAFKRRKQKLSVYIFFSLTKDSPTKLKIIWAC
jgi:hypothetical protein